MKFLLATIVIVLLPALAPGGDRPVAPNGIPLIEGYRGWQVIAPSYREDRGHIRVIVGNDTAVNAMKNGTRPFPDGTVLAKVAWTAAKHPKFPVATVPDTFVQVEFMVKDAQKYGTTGGWGFARFVGNSLTPYGKDASFARECFGCHLPVKGNDYVFTGLAPVP